MGFVVDCESKLKKDDSTHNYTCVVYKKTDGDNKICEKRNLMDQYYWQKVMNA